VSGVDRSSLPGPSNDPDDLVPISVRLGSVVPPEDPEDWTRPLTWVVALGMLGAPLLAAGWFLLSPPAGSDVPLPGTWLVAVALAGGAAAAGATQADRARAFAGTLAAGLFGALVSVMVGLVLSGDRQVEAASPMLGHALAAGLAGMTGAVPAAILGPLGVRRWSVFRRAALGGSVAVAVAVAALPFLFAA